MDHLVTHLLTALALLLIAKTVRQFAEKRMGGLEGRITLIARLLPVFLVGCLSIVAFHALQDPDPEDRLVGVGVLVLALLLFGVLVHYWSYRLLVSDECVLVQSLVGKDRIIHFEEPFDLVVAADQKQFLLKQNGQTIKVSWIVSGYPELLARIMEQQEVFAERRQKNQGHKLSMYQMILSLMILSQCFWLSRRCLAF